MRRWQYNRTVIDGAALIRGEGDDEMQRLGRDGWELVERLSSDPRTKDIPVVVLTACATESVRQRAERERLAGFFFKPCAPDVLAAELRRLCAARPSNVA